MTNDGTSPPGSAPPRAEDATAGRGAAGAARDEGHGAGRRTASAEGAPHGAGGDEGENDDGDEGDGDEGDGDEGDEKDDAPKGSEDEAEVEDVEDDTRTTLLETRTVLPGLQTLFGFQLAVIFTEHFGEKLSRTDQLVHFASLSLVAIAVALVMAPAAYHRQVEPSRASRRFTRIASRCLMASMGVMTFAMALNFFLIADVVFRDATAAYVSAAGAFVIFGGLWFLFPIVSRTLDPPPPAQ